MENYNYVEINDMVNKFFDQAKAYLSDKYDCFTYEYNKKLKPIFALTPRVDFDDARFLEGTPLIERRSLPLAVFISFSFPVKTTSFRRTKK